MSAKRVVVTGLGTTSPLGGDVASTWEAMVKGQSGVRHLTEDWAEQMPVKMRAIEQAWAARDFDTLASLAHWLKGSGGRFSRSSKGFRR